MVLIGDGNFCSTCGYLVWPGPALTDRILPGPIKNRVGFGFLKKKPEAGPGFYKNLAQTRTRPDLVIYIYIYV